MKTTQELYEVYRIMPPLQVHQLRVAAVGKMICDTFELPVHTEDVILTCLFHDMGNIIKSNLHVFPDFLEPGTISYWEQVKADYMATYGTDEHHATLVIGHEIGLPSSVIEYMDAISYSNLEVIRDSNSFEQKICEYADMRVAPLGIVAMDERIMEMKSRYANGTSGMSKNDEHFMVLFDCARELEQQIFNHASIKPEDITDESCAAIVEELRSYQLT